MMIIFSIDKAQKQALFAPMRRAAWRWGLRGVSSGDEGESTVS